MILKNEFLSLYENYTKANFYKQIDGKIYIYGAGNIGKEIHKILTNEGLIIESFLDINADKFPKTQGIKVLHPENLDQSSIKNATIIMGIHNPYVDMVKVFDYLLHLGFKKIINYLDFFQYFSHQLKNKFWLTSYKNYAGKENLLLECAEIWEDEISRNHYENIFKFRQSNDFGTLSLPETDIAYFDKNLPIKKPQVFYDCGSYDGDTIRKMYERFGKATTIYSFEPDMINYSKLVKNNQKTNYAEQCYHIPCGVWSETKILKFNSGQGEASKISDTTFDTMIQCISLDDFCTSEIPTYIKMDIEGAEYQALIGAERLLTEHKPDLVISLYHNPEHLWQIPLYLKKLNLGYRFYLRTYCFSTFETVCYAIQ